MLKVARVIITTECNLKCEYCCNKIPDIQKSFNMTTMDQLQNMEYDIINITGGEPMLSFDKLKSLCSKIQDKKTYLYTNGYFLYRINEIATLLDGINIGHHNNFTSSLRGAKEWKLYIKNVILHAQKGKLSAYEIDALKHENIKLKEWTLNDCNKTKEDRWII